MRDSMTIKTPEEMLLMERSCAILAEIVALLSLAVKPGITTGSLDAYAETLMHERKVKPSFKGYHEYPACICTSVNDEVVHVIPGNRVLREGDILSIDAGVIYKEFNSDMAVTVPVGTISPQARQLIEVTREAMLKGIEKVRPDVRVGEISHAIETYVHSKGFDVVRELVGHGIGRLLHEDPPIPNYGPKHSGAILKEGMTIAIEPMVTVGSPDVMIDGWRVTTKDGSLSAHFEHTVGIYSDGGRILTTAD